MRYDANMLSDRKKLILKAVVEAHIELGEPVGSKYLTQNKKIAYSSATIRNEMAELEEMGYLEQPHTSAGRIPSELGYRFYVDSLAEEYNLTNKEISELQSKLNDKQAELDGILDTAVKLASSMTNYTALVVKPKPARITATRFELMQMGPRNIVLIIALDTGSVKTKHIRSSLDIDEEGVRCVSAVLNELIVGKNADEITLPMLMRMESLVGRYNYLVSPIIKAICETLTMIDGGDLKIDGINRMLSYSEHYDIERLRELLAMFERKNELLEIVGNSGERGDSLPAAMDDKVQVYIGSENTVKIMDNSTLIFKTIRDGDRTVGAIGIIGPTRMDYSKVIATIDNLTSGITSLLSAHSDSDED